MVAKTTAPISPTDALPDALIQPRLGILSIRFSSVAEPTRTKIRLPHVKAEVICVE